MQNFKLTQKIEPNKKFKAVQIVTIVRGPSKKVYTKLSMMSNDMIKQAKFDILAEKKLADKKDLKKIQKALNIGLMAGLRLGRSIYGPKDQKCPKCGSKLEWVIPPIPKARPFLQCTDGDCNWMSDDGDPTGPEQGEGNLPLEILAQVEFLAQRYPQVNLIAGRDLYVNMKREDFDYLDALVIELNRRRRKP